MMLFLCPKGHTYQDAHGIRFSINFASGDPADGANMETKPLCPFCYLEWAEGQFPTTAISVGNIPVRGNDA